MAPRCDGCGRRSVINSVLVVLRKVADILVGLSFLVWLVIEDVADVKGASLLRLLGRFGHAEGLREKPEGRKAIRRMKLV